MSANAQPNLFEPAPAATAPLGLTYVKEGLTAAREQQLARFVEGLNFRPFAFRGFTGKRRTVSFGWRYDFEGGGFQPSEPMPTEVEELREIAAAVSGIAPHALEQCSIIEYAPGAGIGWHRDRPQFGKVVGVSLLAPCRMRFRREGDGGGWQRDALDLAPRSLYVLDGEARALWQHSIPPLQSLRYSVTFRTLSALGSSLVKR
jgi:alkylated DNA repair dioxygenase AlkB